MKTLTSFILNAPLTCIGVMLVLISLPKRIVWNKSIYAVECNLKSLWWSGIIGSGVRAAAIGHVILLGPKALQNDDYHERIHVLQHIKYPLIFPALYYLETIQKGYRNNKFEVEAYKIYTNHETSRN